MPRAFLLKARYGYLTVTGEKVDRRVRVVCDCGRDKLIRPPELVSGRAISCGCRFAETRHRKADPDTSHQEYFVWVDMKRRCYEPTRHAFRYYGGRGITICADWLTGRDGMNGFRTFLSDMGKRPENSSIERLDNDGPYSPENCVWADCKDQARNQRRIRKLTYRGQTACLSELCEAFGRKAKIVRQRINKLGWPLERALDTPTP